MQGFSSQILTVRLSPDQLSNLGTLLGPSPHDGQGQSTQASGTVRSRLLCVPRATVSVEVTFCLPSDLEPQSHLGGGFLSAVARPACHPCALLVRPVSCFSQSLETQPAQSFHPPGLLWNYYMSLTNKMCGLLIHRHVSLLHHFPLETKVRRHRRLNMDDVRVPALNLPSGLCGRQGIAFPEPPGSRGRSGTMTPAKDEPE